MSETGQEVVGGSAPGVRLGSGLAAAELLRRVRLVECRARRLVEDWLTGPYRSVFRGRGVEFDELREYQPGDEVRSIDWHATARTGRVQVKRQVEERHQTLVLAVDLSGSGDFGSVPRSKRELAAELGAVLALSAVMNHDCVGLLLFTDRVERYVPPRAGRFQVLAIVASILGHVPHGRGTRIGLALDAFRRAFRRRATVAVISDFLEEGLERSLRLASQRHDVVALRVEDPLERQLPDLGWVVWEDAETGELVEVDTGSPSARHAFNVTRQERADSWRSLCRGAGVDAMTCDTELPYHVALLRFFEERQRRRLGR